MELKRVRPSSHVEKEEKTGPDFLYFHNRDKKL